MSTLTERARNHKSPLARKLLECCIRKNSILCASVDLRTSSELLSLVDKVGPYVCLIKTHIDIVDDFNVSLIKKLKELAVKHDFLIFEDRKFADIGSTVKAQYVGGVFQIASWADITNAHSVPGPGIVKGLREGALESTQEPRGLLMLAELSSQGSLATGEYTEKTVDIAAQFPDFVVGFIAQSRPLGDSCDWLILTPGVGLDDKGDGLGQQYRTVDEVVNSGTDIIIVGRGLYGKGRDPVFEAKRYQSAGWEAYLRKNGGL